MNLSGPQIKQLHAALLDAFPTASALVQMVRFTLGENLHAIASGDNLGDTIFRLLTWAEACGRLPALVEGACDQNPDNATLQQAAAELRSAVAAADTAHQATLPAPWPHEPMPNAALRPDVFAYDVFLSHSSLDKPIVRALAERLRQDGLRVWFEEWVIQPGDIKDLKREDGLQRSRVQILCMSQHAFAAEWVKLERHTLFFRDPTNSQRRFIPLRLDDCTIPDLIAQFASVDWRVPTAEAYAVLRAVCQPLLTTPTANDLQLRQATADPADIPSTTEQAGADHLPHHQSHLPSPTALAGTDIGGTTPITSELIVDDPIVLGFGPINCLTVTPDGYHLIGGSDDCTVKVWEHSSGHCVASLEGHGDSVRAVAVTPDGTQIISGASDGTVKIWERSSGRCVNTLEGHAASIRAVAVTPDGAQIISGVGDGTVKIWERSSGRCMTTLEGHEGSVLTVAVTPDGAQIVSGAGDGTVKVWERNSGRCMTTFEGHGASVLTVTVTPDGAQIISGAVDGTVKIWERSSGRCVATLEGHGDRIWAVAVTPDGAQIISGAGDGTVKIWERSSGRCVNTFEGHCDSVLTVTVTPDGAQIISGAVDGTVKIWERSSGHCVFTIEGHVDSVLAVVVTPDGVQIISGAVDGTVKIWERNSGRCVNTLEGHKASVRAVAVTPDGAQIISGAGDATVKIWERSSGRCVNTLEGHVDNVRAVAVTPDGVQIISGADDGTVKVWERSSGRCVATLEGHEACVRAVAVTPDGVQIISGADDRTVKVWERSSGRCLTTFKGHGDRVWAVAVTPNGAQIISGAGDRTVKVWDRSSGHCAITLEGHGDWVRAVAVTPDGTQIISSADDGTVKIWERSSGHCVVTLKGPTRARVWAVTMTPDGKQIISGSEDRTVRVRRLAPLVRWSTAVEVIQRSSRYTNAKVVLVGESGVGKSGLALRLVQDRWQETGSTHGMEVWPLRLERRQETGDTSGEIEHEVWLWDFAGQPDYRLIHQLYMDETALALLVIDPQRENPFEALAHWERALALAIGQKQGRRPVKVLVAARCDRGGVLVSDRRIAAYCAEHGYSGFCKTAAKVDNDPGCLDLKAAIARAIPWDQLPWTATTQLFRTLKETILQVKTAGLALARLAELRQRMQMLLLTEPFTESDLRTVIRLLAGQGLVMPLAFGDFVLLQPEQINNYASAVVRCARDNSDEIGCVTEAAVLSGNLDFHAMTRLDPADETILLRAMVQTFVERSLCLREETEQGTILVFPSYFRLDRPDITDYPGVFVTYSFAGPLDEIYTTLIVRLHYTNNFEKAQLWHYAADFKTHTGRRVGLLMHKRADDRAELQVYLESGIPTDTQVSFIKYIHEHLRKRGQEVTRLRTYRCPQCQTVIAPQRVKQRLERGHTQISCDDCDAAFSLIDLIEEKFASDDFAHTVRAMDEAAQINIDRQTLELILVGHALAIATEAGQRFILERNEELATDGYIELCDDTGRWSQLRIYLKLLMTDIRHRHSSDRAKSLEATIPFDEQLHRMWSSRGLIVMFVSRSEDSKIEWMGRIGNSSNIQVETFTALNLERKRKQLFVTT